MPLLSPPRIFRAGLIASFLIALPAGSRASHEDEPDSPPVSSDPLFTTLGVDGASISGRISAIREDRLILVDLENARHEVALRSLVKLTRQQRPAPRAAGGSHRVLLGDGDRIVQATVMGSTETTLEVQSHSALGRLKVPLECVLALVLLPSSEADALDELTNRVRTEPRTSETIWLANGDRVAGSFLGIDDRAVTLQVDAKAAEYDRTGVVAVGFDPAALNYPRPAGDFLELSLLDGSRLGVTGVEIDRGEVKATTRFGQPIRIPIADLARIDPRTKAVVPLSERKPDGQSYVSYVGPTPPFRADATVEGHRFQLSGQTYDWGLGTQSRTLLAYRLQPGDRRFQALVGVDDRAGPLGSVVFRVLLDGKQAFVTPALCSRDQPRAIDLDVSQAKLLILVTEFGDRGDTRDLADWVEARLIR